MYHRQANELIQLLKKDQADKRATARAYFGTDSKEMFEAKQAELRRRTRQRARRMLEIMTEIGEPSLANIGAEAAQAVSILAVHDTLATAKQVLGSFAKLDQQDRGNTYYQAIPSLTDRVLVLEHNPQRFGTQWLLGADGRPFLPPVEDFEHVNERRVIYDLEPLRWPKSLAIPESRQPWLKFPLSEAAMRQPTAEEYRTFEE